jgi:hypothetical protein
MKSAVFWAVFRCKHGLLSNALVSMAGLALNYVEFLSGWQQAAAEKLLLTARTSALEKCCTACSQSLHFNCKFDSIWASLDAQSACLGRDSQRQTALVNVLPLVWPKVQSVMACQNAWAHSGLENHLVKSGKTGPSGTPASGCCCISTCCSLTKLPHMAGHTSQQWSRLAPSMPQQHGLTLLQPMLDLPISGGAELPLLWGSSMAAGPHHPPQQKHTSQVGVSEPSTPS